MEVTVLLSTDLAAAITAARPTSSRAALEPTLGQWRDRFRALDPGVNDAQLARYFVVDLPDPRTAELVRERLSKLPDVEAAYIKPEDQPP